MKSLLNKTAIITGGSKGIGKSVSLALAKAGAKVFILDIDEKKGFESVDEIINQNGKASFYKIDVSQEKEWDKYSQLLNSDKQPIDILINNAGIFLGKDINNVSMEEYQKVISINLTGVYLGIKYLTPLLVKAGEKSIYGSSIINLSSVAGLKGSPIDPLYSMTKGGITTFTKSMAIYYGRKNIPIRINQVHPGIIETDMGTAVSNARLTQNPKMTSEESYLAGIAQTPLGRLGTAEEVAKTILFLSSDDSSFMTGSSLVVDGGFTA